MRESDPNISIGLQSQSKTQPGNSSITYPVNNFSFGNVDKRTGPSPPPLSADFLQFDEQSKANQTLVGINNNPMIEQHEGLISGKYSPIIDKALTLILWLYWIILIMAIVNIYFLLDAIIEYYELEADGKPKTLSNITRDLLVLFIFGSIYANIVYAIGIIGTYEKSSLALRIFDLGLIILIGSQVMFLANYSTDYNDLWYIFVILIAANTVLLVLSIVLDKILRDIGGNKQYWKELMIVSGFKSQIIEMSSV